MEEPRLDNELERLRKNLSFLWEDYSFHVQYFTRGYGMYYKGFVTVLGNDICNLVFKKETNPAREPIRKIDQLHDLFKGRKEFDRRLEELRNQLKEEQITVQKIREEWARLQTLGQDSSLEAALASLHGGKK